MQSFGGNTPACWMNWSGTKCLYAYEHVLRLQPGDIVVWERLFFLAEDLNKKEKTKEFIIGKILAIDKNNPLVQAHLGQKALNDDRIKIAKISL